MANTSSYAGADEVPNTPSSYRGAEEAELEDRSPGTASKMSSSYAGALGLVAVVGPLKESKSESKEEAEAVGAGAPKRSS